MNTEKKKKNIYLDHAAGTAIDPSVFEKMKPYFTEFFHNPSSIYQQGFDVRSVLDSSREKVAKFLSARAQEIVFTDGGTEANNLAIRGFVSAFARKFPKQKPYILSTKIEHASVLETLKELKSGDLIKLHLLSVDDSGALDLAELKKILREEKPDFLSVAYVNGETGVIQDIREIAKMVRHHKKHQERKFPVFHSDAIQAVNYCNINVQQLGVDMMSVNGSKIYGPKKIAALYIKTGLEIDALVTGGSQEKMLRAGTENIPYIVALAEALSLVRNSCDQEIVRLQELRDFFEAELEKLFSDSFRINSKNTARIPNITNISFPGISSEEVVLRLDAAGIQASMKSACKSDEEGDSHVIRAMHEHNTQSIRFSLGRSSKKEDLEYCLSVLKKIIPEMREVFAEYYPQV